MRSAYLNRLEPMPLPGVYQQDYAINWLKWATERAFESQPNAAARVHKLYDKIEAGGSIASRHSVLKDYRGMSEDHLSMFQKQGVPCWSPPLQQRMQAFAEASHALLKETYVASADRPDYLMSISCTGYDSPNALQRMSQDFGWDQPAPRMLQLGHMGCYAALPAVNLARQILQGQTNSCRVDLNFMELCSLHLNLSSAKPNDIVQNAIFSDGAARLIATTESPVRGYEILGYREELIPGTEQHMTWRPGESFFEMYLDKGIPNIVAETLPAFVERFLRENEVSKNDMARWAIHPGGLRILESVQDVMKLDTSLMQCSYDVYRARGNMSSATLPHIWTRLLEQSDLANDDLICSLAFGPGLTVVGLLFRVVSR